MGLEYHDPFFSFTEPCYDVNPLSIRVLPSEISLQFVASYDVKDRCNSTYITRASATSLPDLYVCTQRKIVLYNLRTMKQTSEKTMRGSSSLCATEKMEIFILSPGDINTTNLVRTSADLSSEPQTIASFNDKLRVAAYLASVDNLVIITNRGDTCLHLYDCITLKTSTVTVPFSPRVVCAHPDGTILLTSEEDVLYKYRIISSSEIALEWECPSLCEAYGICVMSGGLIIVGTRDQGVLYVVSASGKHSDHNE